MEEEAAFFDTRLVAGHQVQSVDTTRFSGQRRARELVSPASLFFFFWSFFLGKNKNNSIITRLHWHVLCEF